MRRADAVCVHSPDGSTFLHEIRLWPPSSTYTVNWCGFTWRITSRQISSQSDLKRWILRIFLHLLKEQSGQISSRSESKRRNLRIFLYLLEEQSCQISPRSDLKRRNLRIFRRCHPNKNKKNKISSDIGSVPDLKIIINMNGTHYSHENDSKMESGSGPPGNATERIKVQYRGRINQTPINCRTLPISRITESERESMSHCVGGPFSYLQ